MRWYREYLVSFPTDPAAPQSNFLLAELLFEDKPLRRGQRRVREDRLRLPGAREERRRRLRRPARLRAAAEARRRRPRCRRCSAPASPAPCASPTPSARRSAHRPGARRCRREALRAEATAPRPRRRGAARARPAAARRRGAAPRRLDRARATPRSRPAPSTAPRSSYAEALKLTPERDAGRNDLVERQAAAIYKQGEQARAAGQTRDAVGHFDRVAAVAPQSTVRAAAQYDASAALIVLKDWDGAIRTLEDFRARFPNHALQGEVERQARRGLPGEGPVGRAAGEFERLAAPAPTRRSAATRSGSPPSSTRRPASRPNATQVLRALPRQASAAARAGGRGALAPLHARRGRRQRRARGGADEGHLPRRPERRRRPHRPHPLPRRHRRAGDGRAGRRRVPQGRAGRAAAAAAAR